MNRARDPRVVRTVGVEATNGASRGAWPPADVESGMLRGAGPDPRPSTRKDGPVRMWNRLLDRIAPLMAEDVSDLDRRDGVAAPAADQPAPDTLPARQA